MATQEERITDAELVLTTDPKGVFTFSPFLSVLSPSDYSFESVMSNMVLKAMPGNLFMPFLETSSDAGDVFVTRLAVEFDHETYPHWLAQLPTPAQKYFQSRWMGAILDETDLLGSSSITVTALVPTRGSNGVTSTVTGSAIFAKSQSWHYMSILTERVPATVQNLTSGGDADFATAMYRQFTSGTAPPWFQAMPTDAQSFVVLDYLPNWLSEPMALEVLAVASPASRPTSTTGPTDTIVPTVILKPTPSTMNQTSSKRGTIVAVILIPLFILALALGFAIFFVRYRRRRRAKSLASSLPPLDPEQAVRRWSETTFSTAVSPQEPRHQSSFLPPITLMESPGRDSHALRRALSESDVGQVANLELKAKDLEGVETQSDRAELEARTAPLVKC